MAKPFDRGSASSNGAGSALADKEKPVSDTAFGGREEFNRAPREESQRSATERRNFFDIYKPSQGYHTRIWTGISTGILICWFAYFLYEKLDLVGASSSAKYIQVGIPVAIILGFGLLTYWALALNRRVCDFLIATEGEMKKVNWTSRKEIIGSTKVVVFVVVAMSLLLFFVDILFMLFFNAIGILKGEGIIDAIKRIF